MDDIMIILPDETEEDVLIRIAEAKRNGLLDMYWPEIAQWMNEHFREDEEHYYSDSAYRKRAKSYFDAKERIEKERAAKNGDNTYLIQKRELEKERIKFQTEKLEYNRWVREEARDELIVEKICNAVRELTPLSIPDCRCTWNEDKSGILAFGDEHYATEFIIYGLHGEILNQYNPEIFEQRMWDLLSQVKYIIEKEDLSTLNVFSLGDFTDGVLRCGQLRKLRYGVVEGSVRYANFISTWLNELSKYVRIKYQMVYGNHSELRLLGQPKGTFKDENTGLFVREIIKTHLEDNPNFEMVVNPTGLIFDTIEGFNVLGIHGEVRNMENAIKDFSNTYNTKIDILIGGHMHHYKGETVGVNRDVINVPSVIGIDDFSMTLNRTSRPGATFLTVNKDDGISVEYKIKL